MMRTTRRVIPATFAEMSAVLADRNYRTVCNNTTLERLSTGAMAVALHGHRLATFWTDGTVWITDAGYVTTTTYDRLKRLVAPLGATVFRRHGVGYVRTRDGVTLPITGGVVRFRADGSTYLV